MTVCCYTQTLIAMSNRKIALGSLQSFVSSVVSASPLKRSSRTVDRIFLQRFCKRYLVMDVGSSTCSSNANINAPPTTQRSYQVVVAATPHMGIGKDGKLPWRLPGDLKYFKEVTSVTSDPSKRNAVLMGRKTWESIPTKFRPLPGRLNVVLTRSGTAENSTADNVIFSGSIQLALKLLAEPPYNLSIEKVFLIGGGQILREGLNGPECEAIHITEIVTPIACDTFIPPIDLSLFQRWYSSSPTVESGVSYCFATYVRLKASSDTLFPKSPKLMDFLFLPNFVFEKHEEFLYLRLVQDIISNGNNKDDRTGTGTLSKFGCQMRFNLRKSFPLLTTKRVFWRGVVEELLWFISGSTNAKANNGGFK